MLTAKSLLNTDFEQWKMIARQTSASSSVVALIEEITRLLSYSCLLRNFINAGIRADFVPKDVESIFYLFSVDIT